MEAMAWTRLATWVSDRVLPPALICSMWKLALPAPPAIVILSSVPMTLIVRLLPDWLNQS